MSEHNLYISSNTNHVLLKFSGELTLHTVSVFEKQISNLNNKDSISFEISLNDVKSIDTAGAVFIYSLTQKYTNVQLVSINQSINETLELVENTIKKPISQSVMKPLSFIEKLGKKLHDNYLVFLSFIHFLGMLFITKLSYLTSFKNIRFREIAFEINETGIKSFGIIMLTSFLIGLVVAYQSAFQLKLYGANIYLVDMLGISIFRELAPLITAIVIAGRSGSAFTAQIGAMKITEELDAMRTMGFDPYLFLVMPRIVALMITMPILIFLADIMGIFGGMIVANIELDITFSLFIDRFSQVIDIKHFYIGMVKGPMFAFLIATIAIYRGLMVKNDTQSIGLNTTKSVVESILAVIVCDALVSIALTNLGI